MELLGRGKVVVWVLLVWFRLVEFLFGDGKFVGNYQVGLVGQGYVRWVESNREIFGSYQGEGQTIIRLESKICFLDEQSGFCYGLVLGEENFK